MTLEEVKKFLSDTQEGKKLLNDMIENHESIRGLKDKKDELLQANKELKKQRDEALNKSKELSEELEEISSKGSQDVQLQVEKSTSKLKKELEQALAKNNEKDSKLKSILVENNLNEALIKSNISKNHMEAVKALIQSKNQISIDEIENTAKIGDKDLLSYVSEWAQSDSGKHYVAVPFNSGGGAPGSNKNIGGMNRDDFNKLSPIEKLRIARENKPV